MRGSRRAIHPIWLAALSLLVACEQSAVPTTAPTTTATITAPSSTSPATTTTTSAPTTTTTDFEPIETDLLVIGDWGSGTLPQGAVAGAMARYAETEVVEAILTTGDNFYSDDAEFVMAPFDWAAEEGVPFWIAWGNHDIESESRIEAVNEAFGDPPRWGTYEWGNIDVIVLDSNQVGSEEQISFLADSLEGSSDPTIVVFHHSALTCANYDDAVSILENWAPLFDFDVFLVLSGHDHNYQRFESEGVTYVVTGGGGQSLYELEECSSDHPERLAGSALHHFVVLDQGPELTIRAVDVDGATFDEVSIAIP
jgi:predicted phosphodiesterase